MRVNLVSLLLLSLSATVMAQDALPEDIAALYSKYGGFEYAVMMMDRDEWEAYRNWEGYNQQDVIDVIKATIARALAALPSLLRLSQGL